LEQQGKLETALGIYAYGLRNVPISNLQQKLLQAAHDKLTRQLSPPTAVDPFSQLPLEIAEMVLSYLKFSEVVNCLRVSRHWKAILTSRPMLWTNMDLFVNNEKQVAVRSSSVRALIKYSKCQITRARIHRYSDQGGLRSLATTCKSLLELHFGNTQFGGDTIIETVMMAKALKTLTISRAVMLQLDQVTQIAKSRPTLENLRIDHISPPRHMAEWKVDLPSFKSLSLTLHLPIGRLQEPYLELLNLNTLFERAPNLTSLSLEGWKSAFAPHMDFSVLKSLETLSLQHTYLLRPPRLPPSLKSINMNDILSPIAHAPESWSFHGPLPALESLRLDGQVYPFSKIGHMLDGWFPDPTIAKGTPLPNESLCLLN
jgi:F-box/TPR repeat protein Pof3